MMHTWLLLEGSPRSPSPQAWIDIEQEGLLAPSIRLLP